MPEEFSLSPLVSPRDLSSPTAGPEPTTDFEIYSGDWASLSAASAAGQGIGKRTPNDAARSLAPSSSSSGQVAWASSEGDLQVGTKTCAFEPGQQRPFPPCGRVACDEAEQDENQCPWQGAGCLHCSASSSAPCWAGAFGSQHEEAQFQRGELRNVQDRLDHIEATLEKWKLGRDELDDRIEAIVKDHCQKFEHLSRACFQLDRRIKKLQLERKGAAANAQDGLDTALREVKDSVKDMNVTLIQGLQDKVRAAEVHKKFSDIDDVLRDLHDEVKVCRHGQLSFCREEDHTALRAQVSLLEAQLWKLQPNTSEVGSSSGGQRSGRAMPGNCISWNLSEAMRMVAREHTNELSFSSFDRVSSSVFNAVEFRGMRLAFVRKTQTSSPWDIPKSWCYLHAPKGTYLDFIMKVGGEERQFAHEFETSRSFGGSFNLPFTSNFDASDLHEGVFVQTLCEGNDGRQTTYPRIACVLEVNDAETINGRSRKVAWVAFPDGSEQAVELYWITCVQKLPPLSVVIVHARQRREFGQDVCVTSSSAAQT